jgi:hypothetical protein
MIFGYDSRPINNYGLKQMNEISIEASPDALRALAQFLAEAAEDLPQAMSDQWHRHIPQELQRALGCDVIVLYSSKRSE